LRAVVTRQSTSLIRWSRAFGAVLILCLLPAAASSQSDDRIVTTSRQVEVQGKPLRYTARAGHLPIRDNETGDVHGNMFFVAYTQPPRAGDRPRPLTFLWTVGRARARLSFTCSALDPGASAAAIRSSTTMARGLIFRISCSSIQSAPVTAAR
jgi:hypothetical protein